MKNSMMALNHSRCCWSDAVLTESQQVLLCLFSSFHCMCPVKHFRLLVWLVMKCSESFVWLLSAHGFPLMDYLRWKQLRERSLQDGWVQTPSLVISLPPSCWRGSTSEYLENQNTWQIINPLHHLPPASVAGSRLVMFKGMWLSDSSLWAQTLRYLGVGLCNQESWSVYACLFKGVWQTILQVNTNVIHTNMGMGGDTGQWTCCT